jgi:hypothetical protein
MCYRACKSVRILVDIVETGMRNTRTPCHTIELVTAFLIVTVGCAERSTTPLTLDSLKVAPLELNPTFSPSVHDYYVACSAGTNSLSVSATASPGALVRLFRPTISAAAPSQNLDVDVLEDQAIVLEVSVADFTDQYWVRCLPHDFPLVNATQYPVEGATLDGWYLMANLSLASGESSFAMAVNARGTPVWYRRVSTIPGAINVEALARNTLSFSQTLGTSFGIDPNEPYELHQLGASQVRYVQAVGAPTDHHDLRLLPNGDTMVIAYPITANVDLTGNGSYGPGAAIADCAIQEVDSTGALVWSWLASQHFDAAKESVAPPLATVNEEGAVEEVVDAFHCNSIDVGGDGNLLVSARHLNAVFLIDKPTGRVVWKLGGVAYNKDGAELIRIQGPPENVFNRQHDARWQANGNVSLFDDHSDGTAPARGVEYAIDLDGGTATLTWQYQGFASSGALGSCRRYSDGHTVVGWGALVGGTGQVLSEVDSAGRDLLDLSFAKGDVSYRGVRVTADLVDLSLLRETAGLP